MASKRYRVSGGCRVFGCDPGTTFTRDIPAEQERQLIQGGHIKEVRTRRKRAPSRTTPAERPLGSADDKEQ